MIRVFYHQLHHKWILAFHLMSGNILSIEWKQSFHWAEANLPKITSSVAEHM